MPGATVHPGRVRWKLGALAAAAVVIGACGSSAPPPTATPAPTPAATFPLSPTFPRATPVPTAAPTEPPATPPPTPARTPPPATTPPASPSGSGPAASSGGARIDPTLLELLPATVDGRDVLEMPELEQQFAQDPSLGLLGQRLAVAQAGDAAGGNIAVITLIEVVPLARSDAAFESYRTSYDQSACAQAGGVGTSSTEEIAGRTVAVTECGGGPRAYHVRVRGNSIIISIFSVGEKLYGEQLVAGLKQ